ncbi:SNF2 family N-terminal domain-containing protein 7 [Elsinoe fawcettii]|nr:SNF2 family N-terminal domain-containing protein 7 [Elsinoe fawcettii]
MPKRKTASDSSPSVLARKKVQTRDIRSFWGRSDRGDQRPQNTRAVSLATSALSTTSSASIPIIEIVKCDPGLLIDFQPGPSVEAQSTDRLPFTDSSGDESRVKDTVNPETTTFTVDPDTSHITSTRRRSGRVSTFKLVIEPDSDDERPKPRRTRRRGSGQSSDFSPDDDRAASLISDGDDDGIVDSSELDVGEPESDTSVDGGRSKARSRSRKAKGTKTISTKDVGGRSEAHVAPLSGAATSKKKNTKDRMNNLSGGAQFRQLDPSLPPITNVHDAFRDMTKKALSLGLQKAIGELKGRTLRIATMCSGTESPLLALQLIQGILNDAVGESFDTVHLFSAEIVPFKQAYIERNFQVPLIFRDITELTGVKDQTATATTAYGAQALVPADLDLIIAGTACVDYSALNSKKKTIDDEGESGDTFRAVLAYAKVWRPKMLILENVFTAPWDNMLAMYEDIDYKAAGVLVDTKNYYLPQTRQRGYMFCIDPSICEDDKEASKIAQHWVRYMERLKRQASSPAAAFMLDDDDQAVLRARELTKRRSVLDTALREVDWSKCLLRHIEYRRKEKIGNARPYTSWQESGSMRLPSNADSSWFRAMVERIWDMIDCSLLRKAHPDGGNFDITFKHRISNVSQNLDRNPDTTPPGIAQCITPSGIFFLSIRGGPLTSEETLALQGLPLDKISFTTETPRQIQDMAGNAMSSTVVGASMLAALLATPSRCLGVATDDSAKPVLNKAKIEVMASTAVALDLSSSHDVIDVSLLLAEAVASSKKCSCEGPSDLAKRPIQQCADCGHTTCLACGGKPQHNYSGCHTQRTDRLDPVEFRHRWAPRFPSHLRITTGEDIGALLSSAMTDANPGYVRILTRTIEYPYRFSHLQRGRSWSAVWSSERSKLELEIAASGLHWRLYAFPDADLPANDRLRRFLDRPIAEAIVTGNEVFAEDWRIRYPQKRTSQLVISPASAEMIASWMARLQLPAFEDHVVPAILNVVGSDESPEGIEGTYIALPHCGTASECLYKRSGATVPDRYLMLDPDPIADASSDTMMFTDDIEAKKYPEVRQHFGRLPPAWRPWSGPTASKSSSITVDDAWLTVSKKSMKVVELSTSLEAHCIDTSRDVRLDAGDCSHAIELISFSSLAAQQSTADPNFADTSWMFANAQSAFPAVHNAPIIISEAAASCTTCLPATAPLRWKWSTDMKSLRPYEHPAAATEYEAKLKARPAVVQLHTSGDAVAQRISVRVNLATLAHRATSRLEQLCTSMTAARPSVTWGVDPAYAEASALELPTFSLQNNDSDVPLACPVKFHITLWPKQQRSLAWMLNQEANGGREYMIEEVEETLLPNVDWRIEVKASRKHSVKGGIQASHPGFGKTICTLALIGTDYHDRSTVDIVSDMATSLNDAIVPGPIPHSGTLVIAPKTLVQQWASEVDKVLGKEFARTTITVNVVNDLAKHSIENFLRARIIVVNQDLLTSDAYVRRLAAFAGVPEPNSTRGRQYTSWLAFVNGQIYQHADILIKHGRKRFEETVKLAYNEHKEDPDFASFVPSKRLKGQAYANRETEGPGSTKRARIPNLDTDALASTGHALFELFRFNRIVVDEFTYLTAKDYAAVENLKADKRWALSATAKIQDPYDIAKMADLIGVRLRVSENAPGALSTKNFKAILEEKTDFEQFQTFRSSASMAVTKRTFELAQDFLNSFVRQNILEFDDWPYMDYLVPVPLSHAHRLIYTEVSQHLNSSDMRIKKTKKAEDRDRDYQIADVLEDAQSAEEALVRLAATVNQDRYAKRDGIVTTHAVCARRSQQVEEARKRLEQAIQQLVSMIKSKPVKSQSVTKTAKDKDKVGDLYESWRANILEVGSLGDEDARLTIAKLLQAAQRCSAVKASDEKIKGQLSKTNDIAKQYLVTSRSVRFVKNSQVLLGKADDRLCNSADCLTTADAELSVSALCGHIICEDCWNTSQLSTGLCAAVGCNAPIHSYHLLRSSKLEQAQPDVALAGLPGAKIKAVVDQLQSIKDDNEQAILFVQYAEQINDMESACRTSGIGCVCVRENSSASAQVTKFQTETDPRTRATVIILNGSDSSAAGINLTMANHVLFLSPLLMDSQYEYDAAMAQAIGRVRRPGQTRDIHVYRFVALDTIDVDIIEHRERRRDALSQLGAKDIKLVHRDGTATNRFNASESKGDMELERTQLIKDGKGFFRLMPKSWSVGDNEETGVTGIQGRARVTGYEDYSSLVKFSKAYSEED